MFWIALTKLSFYNKKCYLSKHAQTPQLSLSLFLAFSLPLSLSSPSLSLALALTHTHTPSTNAHAYQQTNAHILYLTKLKAGRTHIQYNGNVFGEDDDCKEYVD